MPPILELSEISKSFPGVQALNKVNFSVEQGEVHALLGENGAGKSTLIKIISGVYQADQGQMLIDGQPCIFHNPREAQRAGVATIFQELILYPELTVAENIFMGHAPRSRYGLIDWRAMRQRAQELLASLEIYDMDVDSKVGAMSVGKRQRVEIAKALSHNARILIMDEPTAALTEADVERLFGIVRLLKQRGVSIIYISHRLEEIFMLADRVTVLRDGQYVATKAVSDTHEGDLIQMMVGREIDDLFPKLPAKLGETILRVDNVVRHPLPRGVSLEVRAGEIVGLAGLVGSGRTELAHVLFGIAPAERGEIWLEGKRVLIKSPSQAMRLGLAYVPEDRGNQGLIKQMTVRENTSLAILRSLARAGFVKRGEERTLAERFVGELSVRTPSIEQVVNKLSGGNQQKIVVSKWLASQPKLLIMDEPTRGVDVGAKSEIHRLISQLASEGMAILMISSELPEILGMSDRVLVMREGRIVAEFSRDEATQERVGAAMMGEVYR